MLHHKKIDFTSKDSKEEYVVAKILDSNNKIVCENTFHKRDIVTFFGRLIFAKYYINQLQLQTAYFWAEKTIEKLNRAHQNSAGVDVEKIYKELSKTIQ